MLLMFFCITGFHNRFSADDYCALATVDRIGILSSINCLYQTTEGSFGQGILIYTFAKLFYGSNNLCVFNVSQFLLLYFAMYLNINALLKKYTDANFNGLSIFITGALINAWFFNYIYSNDTWFWFMGVLSYITPISILLYALYFYFFKKNKLYLCISCLLFILFAGVRFNYTISIIAMMISIVMVLYFINKRYITLLIPMIVFILIGAFIYIVAPGNGHRRALHIDTSIMAILKNTITGYLKLFESLWLRKLPYQALYLAPLIVIGFYIEPFKKHNLSIIKVLSVYFIVMSAAISAHMMLLYVATGYTSNYSVRVLMLISLLFTVFNAIIIIYIGEKYSQKEKIISLIVYSLISISIVYSVIFFSNKIKISKLYAEKYDERIQLIKEKNNNNDTVIFIPKLPDSGIIHTAELAKTSEIKEIWRNDCFEEYYKVNKQVYTQY